ncbi:MAG: hypothetical protein IKA04_00960 [Alistipes sp.]|nr:hypothetical protein [Alistipes sp.]
MKKLFLLLAVVALGFTACDKENNQPDTNIPKVGDLVTKDGVKGVVFYADDNVTKIVSVEQTMLSWCIVDGTEATGATDTEDGAKNMATIKSLTDWENRHPAFKWCDDYGQGWYLPASTELEQIYLNREIINATLSVNGFELLKTDVEPGESSWYWSSTEKGVGLVKGAIARPFAGGSPIPSSKSAEMYIRAVLAY